MSTRRLGKLLFDLRQGFWFRPLVLLALGIGVGIALTAFDEWLVDTHRTVFLARAASPGGARAVLSVAAGALATTLAIALSMTMVTVQLASSQYTPRLMRRFLSDRFTQSVLGAFLATIAFAFLLLRAIRTPDEGAAFVPVIGLTIAVVLTLGCFALLVVFLHRTMRSMQASTIVASIGRETERSIREIDADSLLPAHDVPAGSPHLVVSTASGYVQLVDEAGIRGLLATAGIGHVRLDASPGQFVIPGTALLSIHGAAEVSLDTLVKLRDYFALGAERTPESDLGFGVRQLVDTALKALSPGINDVTTAVMVVNELAVIGRAVVDTGFARGRWRVRAAPELPVFEVAVLDLENYLRLAFDEIVLAAATQPRVHVRILELLRELARDGLDGEIGDVLLAYERHVREALGPQMAVDRGVPVAVRARILADAPTITTRAVVRSSAPSRERARS